MTATHAIPPHVRSIMQDAAERYHLTIEEMIYGPKTAHACAAKARIVQSLRKLGFSYPNIGHHLHLTHTSVMHYTKARPKIKPAPVIIPCPDYSGEWAI